MKLNDIPVVVDAVIIYFVGRFRVFSSVTRLILVTDCSFLVVLLKFYELGQFGKCHKSKLSTWENWLKSSDHSIFKSRELRRAWLVPESKRAIKPTRLPVLRGSLGGHLLYVTLPLLCKEAVFTTRTRDLWVTKEQPFRCSKAHPCTFQKYMCLFSNSIISIERSFYLVYNNYFYFL